MDSIESRRAALTIVDREVSLDVFDHACKVHLPDP